jgi:phytoene/squalene synthetase
MSIALYNQTTYKCSKTITKAYSTSFTLGIKSLSKKYRDPIYAIYGFVRLADEIVDTFHNYDKTKLLNDFKKQTYEAIEDKISTNPILHSFQEVVNEYDIDIKLIDAFLKSMEFDLKENSYDTSLFKEYIYGSAEVVGLMCLKVFCKTEKDYQHLLPHACSLGAAFQKVNFLRDIKSDFYDRGRVYFPEMQWDNFDNKQKKKIEQSIEEDFKHALIGIMQLPKGAKYGVYLAYVYYLTLFKKIKKLQAQQIKEGRIRVPDYRKIALLLNTMVKSKLNVI